MQNLGSTWGMEKAPVSQTLAEKVLHSAAIKIGDSRFKQFSGFILLLTCEGGAALH